MNGTSRRRVPAPVLGLVMLLTEDQPAVEGFTGCPTGAVVCLTFSASPTVP